VRALERPAEPEILAQKRSTWTEKLVAKRKSTPSARPDSSKYGHPQIRAKLSQMSHYKCFYCEQSVKGEQNATIDHYFEVAEYPDRAYSWKNLYLCCKGCNLAKKANTKLPVEQCLDPCDPKVKPAEHLTFERECILPRRGSERGRDTIAKYQLNRDALDLARSRELNRFYETLTEILSVRKRPQLNDDERALLLRFTEQEYPFSLMFQICLDESPLEFPKDPATP